MIKFKEVVEKILWERFETEPEYIKITTGVLDECIATAVKTHGDFTTIFIVRDLSYKEHNCVSIMVYNVDYRGVSVSPPILETYK